MATEQLEAVEAGDSNTVELPLKLVAITRDNSKITVEVAEHEIPILQLIHTEENIQEIDGDDPGTILVSANAEQELLRLRNKYDQKNEQVVQAIYPRGARDLEAEGFAVNGKKAERPVRAQVKNHATAAKKAAAKKTAK
jgi:hypothetical protein